MEHKLYIALSLFLPYFMGLGLLIHSASPRSLKNIPGTNQEVARFLAFNILFGVSLNHLLMLFLRDVRTSLIFGAILSVVGFACAFLAVRHSFPKYFKLGLFPGTITLLTASLFLVLIINSQLGWDALFIWFFHGKMIYYSGGLSPAAGWSNPAYQFSHVDYPKLIAVLAAQFAYVTGAWNDYLPRLSLLTLLVPAILGVSSFFKRVNVSFIYLYLMVFFSLNVYTFNGYVDAYLAIYICLSLLFLWRGWTTENTDDVLTSFAFIAIIPLMKNEGMLFIVTIVLSIIILLVIDDKKSFILKIVKIRLLFLSLLMLLSNVVLWAWIKCQWKLDNDLNIGYDSLGLIIGRIRDGSMPIIMKYMFYETSLSTSLLILSIAVLFSMNSRVFSLNSIVLFVSVGLLYFSGIFLIYMSTPHDLLWHVSSSGYRTVMPVNLTIIAATYVLLKRMEEN